MKKEGKHSFVLINYFLLPLVFAPLVYCPVCVAALKTRLKNLIQILWEISWRHETCTNLPAWWLCFSSGFLFFPQGKCSQKSWSGFEFEELKLGFLLPSASQSGGFKTAMSGNRSASKFPNLSSLSGFEQPPIFNIVQCSQLYPILPKKAVLKSKIRVVKLCVDHSYTEIPSHPRNVRFSSFAFESLKPNQENFVRIRKKHHQSFKSDKQAQLFH